jgi:hypothetical protein
VEIAVEPALAPYISEREWHPSQATRTLADGSLLLTLRVSIDPPLRRWILGLGSQVQVLAPSSLAQQVRSELLAAQARYAGDVAPSRPQPVAKSPSQRLLPFGELRILTLVGEQVA